MIAPPPVESALLLSVAQVATMLGCSPRHIWRMTDSGTFPRPVLLGSKLKRWPRSTVELWLAECSTSRPGFDAASGDELPAPSKPKGANPHA